MKTILCYCPNHLDGISFYRMQGPLIELEKEGLVKILNYTNNFEDLKDWIWFHKADIVFVQRPRNSMDFQFIRTCEKWKKPIWFDIDDDLQNLPEDNDVQYMFSSSEAKAVLDYILKNASVVTVASKHLQRKYKEELGRDAIYVPNAIPETFIHYQKPFSENKKIMWRGTQSHVPELLYHEKDLLNLIQKYHDREWFFFGVTPYFLYRKMRNAPIKFSRGLLQIDYINALTQYNASIHWVVLLDSSFHRAKSNLAWLDATLAGSVCLAPDFDEWDVPGCQHYKIMDNLDFYQKMAKLIERPVQELKELNELSWNYIKDNLLLNKVNDLRRELIKNL